MSSFVFAAYAASDVTLYESDGDRILRLTITDAYYTDLDGDKVLDVVGFFTVTHFEECESYNIWIFPTLQLPSGKEFNYKFDITDGKKYDSRDYQLIFYDHALETGDYTLFIEVYAVKTRSLLCYYYYRGTADYTFDPPGGTGGHDPLCLLTWL
jgi:hypothetical protein